MLIGVRNWYTELGVTPVHTGTDPGTAFHLDRLAKPFAGYISRSTRRGSNSSVYGAAGLSVTWPRSVPVRLVGVLGIRNADGLLQFRWRLYQGGPGGTLVKTQETATGADPGDGLTNNLIVNLGATYMCDYVHLEWYRNPINPAPLDFRGLWASDALSLAADTMTFELLNDSVYEESTDGGDYTIDRRVWRRIGYSGVIDSAVLNPLNGGDTTESLSEFFAAAGKTSPVIFHRYLYAAMPKEYAVHGVLTEGSGIKHISGPVSRVTVNIEEL